MAGGKAGMYGRVCDAGRVRLYERINPTVQERLVPTPAWYFQLDLQLVYALCFRLKAGQTPYLQRAAGMVDYMSEKYVKNT